MQKLTIYSRNNSSARRGLTLLEILLASAILATALAVIGQQNSVGVRAAIRTQLETEAALHCQSLLNRITSTDVAPQAIPEQPLAGSDGWFWSATISNAPLGGMTAVTVSVRKLGRYELLSRFSLTRFVESPEQGRDQ